MDTLKVPFCVALLQGLVRGPDAIPGYRYLVTEVVFVGLSRLLGGRVVWVESAGFCSLGIAWVWCLNLEAFHGKGFFRGSLIVIVRGGGE